jgi:hypothetical protein
MSEGWAAWELPASEHLRSVAEILSAPESPEERRAERREKAAERAGHDSPAVDGAAAAAFRARVNRTPARPSPLAAAEPFGRDREESARRRAAIDALRPLGLADVITGGHSGCVLDPHLGLLESAPEVAARAEMDRQYEFGRAERERAERNRAVERFRERLDERFRARGLDDGIRFR